MKSIRNLLSFFIIVLILFKITITIIINTKEKNKEQKSKSSFIALKSGIKFQERNEK